MRPACSRRTVVAKAALRRRTLRPACSRRTVVAKATLRGSTLRTTRSRRTLVAKAALRRPTLRSTRSGRALVAERSLRRATLWSTLPRRTLVAKAARRRPTMRTTRTWCRGLRLAVVTTLASRMAAGPTAWRTSHGRTLFPRAYGVALVVRGRSGATLRPARPRHTLLRVAFVFAPVIRKRRRLGERVLRLGFAPRPRAVRGLPQQHRVLLPHALPEEGGDAPVHDGPVLRRARHRLEPHPLRNVFDRLGPVLGPRADHPVADHEEGVSSRHEDAAHLRQPGRAGLVPGFGIGADAARASPDLALVEPAARQIEPGEAHVMLRGVVVGARVRR